MNIVRYWNPLPIVTHAVDEDSEAVRTLCGLQVKPGWESGDEHLEQTDELFFIGCHRCRSIASKRIATEARP